MASTGTAGITRFFTTCFLSYSGIVWGWSLEFHRGREEKQGAMRKLFLKLGLCRQHWHQKLAIRSHIAEGGPSHSEGRTLQNYRAQEKDEKRSLMQSLCVRDKGRGRGNTNGGRSASCSISTRGCLRYHDSSCLLSIQAVLGTGSHAQHCYLISRQIIPFYRCKIKAWIWKSQDSNSGLSDTKPRVLYTTFRN